MLECPSHIRFAAARSPEASRLDIAYAQKRANVWRPAVSFHSDSSSIAPSRFP